jgi:hypothetical protein
VEFAVYQSWRIAQGRQGDSFYRQFQVLTKDLSFFIVIDILVFHECVCVLCGVCVCVCGHIFVGVV